MAVTPSGRCSLIAQLGSRCVGPARAARAPGRHRRPDAGGRRPSAQRFIFVGREMSIWFSTSAAARAGPGRASSQPFLAGHGERSLNGFQRIFHWNRPMAAPRNTLRMLDVGRASASWRRKPRRSSSAPAIHSDQATPVDCECHARAHPRPRRQAGFRWSPKTSCAPDQRNGHRLAA
jgi:hypothetical protein